MCGLTAVQLPGGNDPEAVRDVTLKLPNVLAYHCWENCVHARDYPLRICDQKRDVG